MYTQIIEQILKNLRYLEDEKIDVLCYELKVIADANVLVLEEDTIEEYIKELYNSIMNDNYLNWKVINNFLRLINTNCGITDNINSFVHTNELKMRLIKIIEEYNRNYIDIESLF